MFEIQKFNYAKVFCDGCGKSVDSQFGTDILRDMDELFGYYLPCVLRWQKRDPADKTKWFCPDCVTDANHRKHEGKGRIEVRPILLHGVRCDLCGELAGQGIGESFFMDEGIAEEEAQDEGFADINGKHYCSDCWNECSELDDSDGDCAPCKNSAWCEGDLPNEKPEASSRCEYIIQNAEGNWIRCPWFSWEQGVKGACSLIDGERCPRVVNWIHEKEGVVRSNEKILREVAEWNRCVEGEYVF